MIDITHISLFTTEACILSFIAKYYLDHRQLKTRRGVYMTVSYVTAISAIACFAVGVYIVLFGMDSIIASHAFLANMSASFLVVNCGYQPADIPLPKEESRFVLSQHLGVGMRTTIGYPSIARAMLAASCTIRTEPESHLVITDLDGKKIVVISPPNSLG